ncbi:protein kinase domain-containing protein [Streptomyces sp. SAS_270]|uniref:protein kinase domain-containing protein n=1 Tax=Streptomyces sp. SAS_270 TaxID=3412748 RepID=UPI00403CCEF0
MSGTNGDGTGEREDYVDGGIKPLTAFDPARIGPYLLLGRLGAGGMGRVFLARSDSGRTVAVKVVHEEHVSDERFRARFRREIEAAGRVAERYTAPVLDAGPDEDPPWVATGYVPGLSLEQVVRRHGPLPTASLHTLADGLLHALKDIHDAQIVHRDLKPSNVMLTVDGTKVIDFGIARALETSVESLLTSTGMVVGSPGFMSPEQIRGQSAGPGSDVFTVGCVLTYAATGRLPFGHGASNQHAVMFQIVQEEPDLEGVEDPALRSLIARCLTKDSEQRPGVDELLATPGRVGPQTAGRGWLPADVVTHLAQQAARLLDAEVQPLREEPADRATVGLRPQAEPPVVVPAGDSSTAQERRPRRRRTIIALPIVVVLTVGGTTMVVLQPWSRDSGGTHAQSPGNSASPTPGDSNSPNRPSSSPSKTAKGKGKDGDGKPTEQGGDGRSQTPGAKPPASGDPSTRSSDSNAGDSSHSSTSPAGSSGSGGGGSSGSGSSSTGSAPPAMKSYRVDYTNSCVGACSMPLKVSWSAVSRATRYDIHYTNKGSNFTAKNVDSIRSTGNTSYTIQGPYSGDEICVSVRAANKYGASAWAENWCGTVPY